MEAAARRGVKFLHFFTSGFSESGNLSLEKELLRAARKGPTRIIGPNCIGIHCNESRVSCDIPKSPATLQGSVGFLGQSGGMTHSFMRMARSRNIELNKVVSYGNQIDVCFEEYLEYFARDDGIRVIGAYIEDIKNGRRFMQALKQTTVKKPLIILKGGVTEQGAKAAASHTGALSARQDLWEALMKQYGCTVATTFEHLVDLVMLASSLRLPAGNRIGFLGAGGGTSVLFTDLSTTSGLALPELNPETQKRIASKISNVNTSTTNPVDLGFHGFDFGVMAHTIESLAMDDAIDVIIPYFSLDFITTFTHDQIKTGPQLIVEAAMKTHKPVIPILSKFTQDSLAIEEVRIMMENIFRSSGLAVFQTPQDAIASISGILAWNTHVFQDRNQYGPVAHCA
ncbi:MAG TPA: hypothetical protein ENN34_11405 [Deltaproteobacteria bacterium]|nr:hypothetical protein [Deltaproteobacteria bacterium]